VLGTWAVGYTPHLAVGVWIGNADNQPFASVTSGETAADTRNRVMAEANTLLALPPDPFEPPLSSTGDAAEPATGTAAEHSATETATPAQDSEPDHEATKEKKHKKHGHHDGHDNSAHESDGEGGDDQRS
jgi:membrane peptidoglycan carboxypeptidase